MAGFSLIKMTERRDGMLDLPGGDDVLRCSVCNTPQRVIGSNEETDTETGQKINVIKMGCLNDSEPTNGLRPCPRYAGGENPDPDLITIVRNLVV